jgi:hypothetical protein
MIFLLFWSTKKLSLKTVLLLFFGILYGASTIGKISSLFSCLLSAEGCSPQSIPFSLRHFWLSAHPLLMFGSFCPFLQTSLQMADGKGNGKGKGKGKGKAKANGNQVMSLPCRVCLSVSLSVVSCCV